MEMIDQADRNQKCAILLFHPEKIESSDERFISAHEIKENRRYHTRFPFKNETG